MLFQLCGSKVEEVVEAVSDSTAGKLSYVGLAAYKSLNYKHAWHHHKQWNVTTGKLIGDMQQTPISEVFKNSTDPATGHSDYFPEKLKDLMSKTQVWCDVMSLGPPDGVFMVKIQEALMNIANNAKGKEKPIIVRFMFGNIVGMPINGNGLIKEMTKNLPKDSNLHIWVGAWRKGVSWNHAKLIAVDGRYLHTGGHNLWDRHYLGKDPVHDLSLEMEGRIAHDGHLYANTQWAHIKHKQNNILGYLADKIPDTLPLIWHNRVIISEYPVGKATWWAPQYHPDMVPRYDSPEGASPVLSIGRLGTLTYKHRPADDAVIAMIDSAKTIIHLALQDLGPVCIPNTKIALPGTCWPKAYLNALARAIWEREVDVEIVLSNPGSMPDGLGPLEACYGNGWSCVDVAAEIIKRIKKQFPTADDAGLRKKVEDNLRVCFIRHAKTSKYNSGMTIGNHTKHFIIDGITSYTGSQNLYVCDLAEWGVVIDDPIVTKKIMDDFWVPLWEASYTGQDCDVNAVMDGLKIERDGAKVNEFSFEGRQKLEQAAAGFAHRSAEQSLYLVDKGAESVATVSESPSEEESLPMDKALVVVNESKDEERKIKETPNEESPQAEEESIKINIVNDVAPRTGIICCM